MASVDTDISQIRWSVKGYPIYDLVARFPLPMWVKAATSPKGDSGIEAHQVYRIKRLLQIQTILAEAVQDSDLGKNLTLCIPHDYNGQFQILPVEQGMFNDISLQDVVKYQPRYIQVVENVSNITTGVKIELNPGDQLEVLGTRLRATKSGVQHYLKLKKKFREFVINPDCGGNFKVIADTIDYNIADILQRFPLPQKVTPVEPEKHSNTLLDLFTAVGKSPVNFMFNQTSQEEYIIGEDGDKINGIVLHADTDMYFYVPESIDPSFIAKEELKLFRRKSFTQDEDEINVNHFICKHGDKPVIRGPVEILFRNLVLPPRPTNLGSNFQNLNSRSAFFEEEEGREEPYANIEFKLGKSKAEKFGKIGTDSESTLSRRQGGTPGLHPRPSIVRLGETQETRPMLMTPKQTHEFITGELDTETIDESDYDQLEHESESDNDGSSNDTASLRHKYVKFHAEEDIDSDIDNGDYEEIDDYADLIATQEAQATSQDHWYMNENQVRMPDGCTSDLKPNKYQATSVIEHVSPPPLPIKDYDRPQTQKRRPIDPKYGESTPTELPLTYRTSVRGVERLPLTSVCTETPPEPPPRRESSMHLSKHMQKVDLDSVQSESLSQNPETVEYQPGAKQDLPDFIGRNSSKTISQPNVSLPTTEELKTLSEDEVVDVLKLLKLSSVVQEKFKENGVDGTLFSALDYEILTTEFGLSSFHALKLMKFINGWRPKNN